jgi:hypothetical protein
LRSRYEARLKDNDKKGGNVDGTKRVVFDDVEVVASTQQVLLCRVSGGEMCGISPLRLLPGSEISRSGDRGRLVLALEVAKSLNLVPSV